MAFATPSKYFFLTVTGRPASCESVVAEYRSGAIIVVVCRRCSLVEVVVNHEVSITVRRCYVYAVTMLICRSAVSNCITLDIVVIASRINRDAIIAIISLCGVGVNRAADDGVKSAIPVQQDAVFIIPLA